MATGNWPWWLMARGAVVVSMRVRALRGTEPPAAERRKIWSRAWGPVAIFGSASSTTRYWFRSVKMVEIWRWPKAS